jgi:hypothetical protein
MTNTAAHITASIRDLTADLHRLYDRIDDAERQGLEQEAMRLEEVARKLEAAIERQTDIRDRMESEAPRHAAEARIAYHDHEDTLDLY